MSQRLWLCHSWLNLDKTIPTIYRYIYSKPHIMSTQTYVMMYNANADTIGIQWHTFDTFYNVALPTLYTEVSIYKISNTYLSNPLWSSQNMVNVTKLVTLWLIFHVAKISTLNDDNCCHQTSRCDYNKRMSKINTMYPMNSAATPPANIMSPYIEWFQI